MPRQIGNLLTKKLVDFLFGIEIGYFYVGKVVCSEKSPCKAKYSWVTDSEVVP
jgi:hypothetical protein